MPGSPRVELPPLADLLARAPELPQADDLARLARARGAETLPDLPRPQRLYGLSGQPRRARPRSIRGDAVADALEPLIQPLLVADQPFEAEAMLDTRSEELSEEARTAFQQRIAWVFYLNGHDREARRIAGMARTGPTEYALHADWVAGLAAWRMGDWREAAEHFATVAARSTDSELAAAGHYWAARADTAGGHPERVQARLRTAARMGETFYGLIAQSALGIRQPPAAMETFTAEDWRALAEQQQCPRRDRARRDRRDPARLRDHPPPGPDRQSARARGADPPRRPAQPHRHPDVPVAQRPARQPLRPRTTATRPRPGGRRAAGGSTRRWSTPTPSRNCSSSPRR